MARQVATDAPHASVIVLVYNELDSVEPLHRELVGVLEGAVHTASGQPAGRADRLVVPLQNQLRG